MIKKYLLLLLVFGFPAFVHAQDGDMSPADSLYMAARTAMARSDFSEALNKFKEFRDKYPNTLLASQAAYYQAFILSRRDDMGSLRKSRAILSDLLAHPVPVREYSRYPRYGHIPITSFQSNNDAKVLMVRVCSALASHGDTSCSSEFITAAQELQCTDDSESNLRLTALSALERMNVKDATPILKKVLTRHEQCPQVRRQAMYIALRQSSPELLDVMYDIARKDSDKQMRLQAIAYMLNMENRDVANKVLTILRSEKDPEIRNVIVRRLSSSRDPGVTSALIDILNK